MEDTKKVTMIAKSLSRFDRKDKHAFIDFADKLKAIHSLLALISTITNGGGDAEADRRRESHEVGAEQHKSLLHARSGYERGRRHGREALRLQNGERTAWKRTKVLESDGGQVLRLPQRHSLGYLPLPGQHKATNETGPR